MQARAAEVIVQTAREALALSMAFDRLTHASHIPTAEEREREREGAAAERVFLARTRSKESLDVELPYLMRSVSSDSVVVPSSPLSTLSVSSDEKDSVISGLGIGRKSPSIGSSAGGGSSSIRYSSITALPRIESESVVLSPNQHHPSQQLSPSSSLGDPSGLAVPSGMMRNISASSTWSDLSSDMATFAEYSNRFVESVVAEASRPHLVPSSSGLGLGTPALSSSHMYFPSAADSGADAEPMLPRTDSDIALMQTVHNRFEEVAEAAAAAAAAAAGSPYALQIPLPVPIPIPLSSPTMGSMPVAELPIPAGSPSVIGTASAEDPAAALGFRLNSYPAVGASESAAVAARAILSQAQVVSFV